MQALDITHREALERLTAALSEALTLRRRIDYQILINTVDARTRDLIRQLRWLCKSEMLNLKSFCHLFSKNKTILGFHNQFNVLLKYANSMLSNQE